MKTFRIFTNDRGRAVSLDGSPRFPLYSAYRDVQALNAKVARMFCPREFDSPHCAEAVAIAWPPETAADKAWIAKHVGK